ncbi:hypothetical protein OKA05_11300 [Luteolibacter arcticus]|uniref:Ig-like domain-containing protein n=1 Tax=Luteolibacter arcticus TaxID=1581411 RepID=A0ABT3GI08_9BACT|nr:LamG-like jellyroll fold domain-containing protein [Luteolibacter arcticus]MCW1923140.1 hypothetical protein [Luteolibacter arcticus]
MPRNLHLLLTTLVTALSLGLGSGTSLWGQVVTPVSATASSFFSSAHDPSNLINGTGMVGGGNILTKTANAHGSAQGMWHSDGSAVAGTWVTFDLGTTYTLSAMDIWTLNQPGYLGRGVQTFSVYTSANTTGPISDYVGSFNLAEGTGANGEPVQRRPFIATGVRRVRFVIANCWSGLANDYVGLAEVRFEGVVESINVASGLAGYWNLDETSGSTAADSSGNGNLGTIHNTSANGGQWTTGKVNGALQLRGAGLGDDYVMVPPVETSPTHTMSLSAWVLAAPNSNDTLTGVVENSARALTVAQEGASLPPTLWQHVCMVADSGRLLVYRNGLLVGSGSYDGTFYDPSNPLVLGAHLLADGTTLDAFWQGKLDEVAYWTRPLTAANVFEVFAAGYHGTAVTTANGYANSPPLFVTPPQSANYYQNQPFSLVADASGLGTLTFQWWKDGVPLANGQSRVFNDPGAGPGASGNYSVVVTDGNGNSTTSTSATISVSLPDLEIEWVPAGVQLSWPAAATGYHLEFSPTLGDPWTDVPGVVNNSVTLPTVVPAQFYRLQTN